jgi:phosphoribosyl 1,2-cyclic phosphodiesterase
MRVTLYGTRGSIPAPGPETMRYGGNTPAVQVRAENGAVLVLDAGSGVRRLGAQLSPTTTRVDILLTHLHMDHIQGLGFFPPLYNPAVEVHLWGPASSTLSLEGRLSRYLSPPLFPHVPSDHLLRSIDGHLDFLAKTLGALMIGAGAAQIAPSALVCWSLARSSK